MTKIHMEKIRRARDESFSGGVLGQVLKLREDKTGIITVPRHLPYLQARTKTVKYVNKH